MVSVSCIWCMVENESDLFRRPFADALKAGTPSVMCSYQRINNSYGCQNSKTLNGLLKEELGFQVGFLHRDARNHAHAVAYTHG